MISTNILRGKFHRSDVDIATIGAHNLWKDVDIIQENDSMCPSCKIMTISSYSRGNERNFIVKYP